MAVWVPPMELCTDNAAMIAAAARFLEPIHIPDLALDAARAADAARLRVAHVVLYGKPGCHLCDDARAAVLAVGAGAPSSSRRWTSRSTRRSTGATASGSRW